MARTEMYTLSLHDALPISTNRRRDSTKVARGGPELGEVDAGEAEGCGVVDAAKVRGHLGHQVVGERVALRSEEHTSELQSQSNLVCRPLLEKKHMLPKINL